MDLNIDINSDFEFLYTNERKQYREIIITGGRGSSKTYSVRQFFTLECLMNKRTFFIFRETKDMVKESREDFSEYLDNSGIKYLLDSMLEKIETENEPIIIKNEIIKFFNGSKIVFSFVNDSVAKKRKSLRVMNGAWIDEAHYLTEYTHRNLLPSIRGFDDTFIIYTFNPQKDDDFLYLRAKNYKSSRLKTLHINYDRNKFFPSVMDDDRKDDYNNLPRDLYNHIWLGEPLNFNDLQVINVDRIGRFDDKQHYEYQTLILSIDTATSTRTGADYSVIAVLGATNNNEYHLVHLARGHWDWHTLMTKILDIYQIAYNLTQQSPQHILIEAKANGNNVIQEIERTTSLNVIPITPMTDKLSRVIDNILPFIDSFKIPIDTTNPFNFWINDYLRELKMFRADGKHEHDDMIDATSQGLGYLASNNIDFATIAETFSKFRKDTY